MPEPGAAQPGMLVDVVYMATDTVAVPDVLGEIASQLGMRVTEGPAELDI